MAVVGVLVLELRLEHVVSIKDRRNVLRALKARLRARHNIAVAEIGGPGLVNQATVAAVTVSGDRPFAARVLQAVEDDAVEMLGGVLVSASVEWMD